MSLSNKDIDHISESDLRELIDTGVPEGVMIDYKRTSYGRTDADVKEFLKDVSSFANSAGGHLIIGMTESNGLATTLIPLPGVDPDKELQRLESIVRDGLEPRVVGIRMKAIMIEGGFAVIIRIPRSWNAPHRVSAKGSNRIYARTAAGAYELSIEELRVIFNRSASAHDRVRAFRAERLSHIAAGDGIVPLATELGRLVLHLIPLSAVASQQTVDIEKGYAQHQKLQPLGIGGVRPRINFDGVICQSGGEACQGYTQLFRNGIVEATKVGIVAQRPQGLSISSHAFDSDIFKALPHYLEALRALEITPPIFMTISLQGVKGAMLSISEEHRLYNPPAPIGRDILELPEITFENFGSLADYQKKARPAFDALWNAAGFPKSEYFDDDDVWVGARRT